MIEMNDREDAFVGLLAFTGGEIALLESIRQGDRTTHSLTGEADEAFTAFLNNRLVTIDDETSVVAMTPKGTRVFEKLDALRATPWRRALQAEGSLYQHAIAHSHHARFQVPIISAHHHQPYPQSDDMTGKYVPFD